MNKKDRITAMAGASLLAALLVFAPANGAPNSVTEIRDPLRGANFYSVEVAADSLQSLQTRGGLFTADDAMTIGVSALFFDESKDVERYILWLRHDGPRRWFAGTEPRPLELWIGGTELLPEQSSSLGAMSVDNSELFVEKMEFVLPATAIEGLAKTTEATLVLQTMLGKVVKELSIDEIETIKRFYKRTTEGLR